MSGPGGARIAPVGRRALAATFRDGHIMPMHSRTTRAAAHAPDFTRSLGALGSVSALAFGTALGDPNDTEDARYGDAIDTALAAGVTVIDTAINYRCQRSERASGRALARARSHALHDGARDGHHMGSIHMGSIM